MISRFWIRRIFILLVVLAGIPAVVAADGARPTWSLGFALEYMRPLDPDLFGATMADNSWGKDISDIDYSTGKDRNSFYFINRYDGLFLPALRQTLRWESGWAIEASESATVLTWAPNKDVDINYTQWMIPLTLSGRYRFFPTRNFHPTAQAGLGAYYFATIIQGEDLYTQRRNPDYDREGTSEDPDPNIAAPREYFRDTKEFTHDGWFPGGFAGLGFEMELAAQLLLNVDFRWSVVPAETIEVVRVTEGNRYSWHWEEGLIKGDAGGLTGAVGVSYEFLP